MVWIHRTAQFHTKPIQPHHHLGAKNPPTKQNKLSQVISLVLTKVILGQVINLNGLMGDSFDWLVFFQPIKQRERESDRSLQAWPTVNAATHRGAEHSSKTGRSLSSLIIIIDVVNSSIAVRLLITCKAGHFYTVCSHSAVMLIKLCVTDINGAETLTVYGET